MDTVWHCDSMITFLLNVNMMAEWLVPKILEDSCLIWPIWQDGASVFLSVDINPQKCIFMIFRTCNVPSIVFGQVYVSFFILLQILYI